MGLSTEQTLYSLLLYEALYPTNHFSDNILVLLKQDKPPSPPKAPSVLKRSYYCSVINHRVRKKTEKRCMSAKNVTEKRSPKRKDSFVFACVSCLNATQIQF